MFENVQTTMIAEDQRLRDLWFPAEKSGQTRPGIHKMEVSKVLRSAGLCDYEVWVWFQGRAHRFSLRTYADSRSVYDIAAMLEEWWQGLTLAGSSLRWR